MGRVARCCIVCHYGVISHDLERLIRLGKSALSHGISGNLYSSEPYCVPLLSAGAVSSFAIRVTYTVWEADVARDAVMGVNT
ncbi:hypothetical protein BHE74_00001882 [Ensete ventricosum]|nr:hypothetical protein BHE74_00001882 [Ensete ventricosum]